MKVYAIQIQYEGFYSVYWTEQEARDMVAVLQPHERNLLTIIEVDLDTQERRELD